MAPTLRFAGIGGAVALASGVLAVAAGARSGGERALYALLGWAAAALPGLAAGVWLSLRHGTEGAGFLVALGAGMILRFAAVLGSLAWVLHAGGGAYRSWLVGAVAGYVPLQAFEIGWFHRRGKQLSGEGTRA